MARIPVVEVITHLPTGGAQRVALTICERLDRSRFAPYLVAGPRGGWLERARAIADCPFMDAHQLVRELSPAKDLRVIGELAEIFIRIKADHPGARPIIHSHAPKAGVAARLAARRLRLPIVHTLHGLPFNEHQSRLKSLAYRAFERVGYLAGGEVVSVTEKNRRVVIERGWVREDRICVIAPCVEMAQLAPRSGPRRVLSHLGVRENERVVAMVASLKPPKDPIGFLDAAHLLAARFPDVRFVLVGDGDMRPQVEAHANRLHLRERVLFTGWLDGIENLYPDLDVLALPSFSEGLPLTLIEARACGVPTVATRVGGVEELIADGENGLLVTPGNPSELALAIGRLLGERETYARIARAGLSGLERYAPEHMVAEYEKLFARVGGA
jgi:glycosyltransferase involved in cell wall biosynthesis